MPLVRIFAPFESELLRFAGAADKTKNGRKARKGNHNSGSEASS
jgi:hypothetical protein